MEKNLLGRLIIKLGLTLGLSLTLSVGAAFAASAYDVVETSATVGTHTSLELEYTIDAQVQTWADADTLTVTLPNNYPIWDSLTFTVENDGDATNNATNETAIAAGGANGQYTDDNGRVLTIKYDLTTWGAVADDAETIRILITGSAAPTFAGTTSTFTWGGATANGGDTNPSGTDTVNVSAADANASIAMADANPGDAGTVTMTLTISSALAATDTITFTAPDVLDVSGIDAGTDVTGTIEAGGGAITCAVSGQIVTCTTSGVITAATGTLIFASGEISGASLGTTDITNLEINRISGSAGGADINSDTTVSLTDLTVAGALTGTNVAPESLSLDTISPNTFTFVTTAAIPTGAKIVIVYPTGWNIAGAASQAASGLSGLTGGWLASVSGQTLTLTKTGGSADAAGTKSLTINGIMTPSNEGSGGTYSITTRTSADANIETEAAVTADVIIGKAASAMVSIGKPTALAVTDDATGVKLTWKDPADATKYISILKGTDPAPVNGSKYAEVAIGKQMYIDTNVKKGDKVTYILRATDGSNTGALTDPVTWVVGSAATAATTTTTTAAETLTVTLSAIGTSGESGTATITEVAGKAKVVLALKGAAKDVSQPAHIHVGSCAKPGDVKYSLTSALNGASETTLAVSIADLKAGLPLMINVHKSVADVAIYSACGDILLAAAKTDAKTDIKTDATVDTSADEDMDDDLDAEDVADEEEDADDDDDAAEDEEMDDAEAPTLTDIATSWAKAEITNMVEKGIIKGHPDGSFKPKDKLKRSEAAILLCRVLSFDEKEEVDADPFTDVKKSAWYGSCISQLKEAEVVKGNPDKTYKPENEINRAEFVALAMRAYGTFLEDDENAEFNAALNSKEPKASFVDVDVKKDWFANIASVAKGNKFVLGGVCTKNAKEKCFNGANSITREEAAAVLDRIFADLL